MKAPLLLPAVLSLFGLCHCSMPVSEGGSLPPATKEHPFVNSLGMKFVPVPGTSILMCTTETTVAQYQAAGLGYQAPQFPQGSNHPAVNVSWNDARAWCAWLSRQEGRNYRLPTDAEWSAAAGGSQYPWGNQWPPPNHCGNYAGQEMKGSSEVVRFMQSIGFGAGQVGVIGGFSDQHVFTAPVGSYPANGLGIHDLGGNVSEWSEDWYHSSRQDRVLRGASWYDSAASYLPSSLQSRGAPLARSGNNGFRCVVVQ